MRHKHFTIALALAWALTGSTGGCAAGETPAATQPAAIEVPIVYSSYFEPEHLNDAQRREINAVIAEAKSMAGEPWFIYVRYSREGTYRLSAYFRPTEARSAVRRGEVVFVDNEMPIDQRRQIVRQLGAEWPAPQPYVQLAAKASDPAAIPAEADLPFTPPDGLGDDELTKIVGAARAAATQDDSAAAEMPIRNIEVGEDGTVRVFFGWQAGGLHGRGVFVALKREGAGFATLSVGMWFS